MVVRRKIYDSILGTFSRIIDDNDNNNDNDEDDVSLCNGDGALTRP
jgi:hypothetical protein